MKPSNTWQKQAAQLCAEFGPEDGVDPRLLQRASQAQHTSRKAWQLAKEAQRVLSMSLAGEIHDPLLRDCQIVQVCPSVQEQYLEITIACEQPITHPELILDKLKQVQGLLRSVLAQSLHRRRVPELRFRLQL